MGAPATFAQTHGLQTVLVAASCLADASAVRDGKSGIVTSAANGSVGVYTFTLSKKFTRMVSGVATINPVDATPTDITCQVAYNESTGVVTVYTLAAAVLTAPEAGSRVSFMAVFSHRSDLKDAA